ncbi:hypothetical protein ACOME3_001034 [Neoechinorhynchus agilis]
MQKPKFKLRNSKDGTSKAYFKPDINHYLRVLEYGCEKWRETMRQLPSITEYQMNFQIDPVCSTFFEEYYSDCGKRMLQLADSLSFLQIAFNDQFLPNVQSLSCGTFEYSKLQNVNELLIKVIDFLKSRKEQVEFSMLIADCKMYLYASFEQVKLARDIIASKILSRLQLQHDRFVLLQSKIV